MPASASRICATTPCSTGRWSCWRACCASWHPRTATRLDADWPSMTELPSVRIAADIRHALRALARKDVYAVTQAGDSGGDYVVQTAQRGQPLLTIPAALVVQMRSRGWLQRDTAGHVRIAAAGIRAL